MDNRTPITFPMSESEYNALEQLIKTKEAQRIHEEVGEGFIVLTFLVILVSAFASDRAVRDANGNIIAILNPASYWWHWRRGDKSLEERARAKAATLNTEVEKSKAEASKEAKARHYSRWMWASKS